MLIEVTDDSGFLALLDPDAYAGFVAEDWEYDQLVAHFVEQMRLRRLLIWATGAENTWRVEIGAGVKPDDEPFRAIDGGIVTTEGRLLLTSYEALTMAAQFDDVRLPEEHQRDQLLRVTPGSYACAIAQRYRPDRVASRYAFSGAKHFSVGLARRADLPEPWPAIPWT